MNLYYHGRCKQKLTLNLDFILVLNWLSDLAAIPIRLVLSTLATL